MIIKVPSLLPLTGLAFICLVAFCLPVQKIDAQTAVTTPRYRVPRRVYWGAYDPYYSITSRVYAQADLIRAQADAAIGYANARNLNAEAYSKELDNWQKQVRVYWDRKITAEKKKLELVHVKQIRRMKYLNDRKWQNSRDWDRLKNHPELSSNHIQSGTALNFLLARLAASSLPYKFDSKSSIYAEQALVELLLDKEWFSHIRLKQGAFTFHADRPIKKEISFWPYLLRWEEFDSARTEFERARSAVVAESESNEQVAVASTQRMQRALMSLTNKFHSSKSVDQWVRQNRRYGQFISSDRFLRELDREIVRVEDTKDIRPFRGQNNFDPATDGNHVIGLLCYLNRNGIEFAAAEPGSEFAYHNLFVLMRSVYLTAAESDQSIRPENLGEIAK